MGNSVSRYRRSGSWRRVRSPAMGPSLAVADGGAPTASRIMRTLKPILLVAVMVFGGLALSSCADTSNPSAIARSTDCRVTVSNPDLAGCDLAHRNLSREDLQADDFRDANLSGVNFDGANLQGARLKGAVLTGVHTNARTVCVNAEYGPCTKPGLRSPRTADAENQ